ncbi:Lysine 6-dehydrogenase [subsurface metagenome]
MKVLVFGGSGKIGSVVAWDLVKDTDVEAVGIVDRRKDALERVNSWINSNKVRLHILDITDREKIKRLMKEYDVGVITLPNRKTSYKVIDTAIEAGLDVVDILEEYHRSPDPYEIEGLEIPDGTTLEEYGEKLHEKAVKNGVTILDGLGFAPGISNVTIGEGIRRLDKAESAVGRVGGIPTKEAAGRHPLKYMITWAFEHVLREYMVKVNVLKNNEVVEVDAMSDRESFRFTQLGKDEELECAITPGMPSFLHTRLQLSEFAEKTIRWPGHFEGINTLKECGILDLAPVEFSGMKIAPRDFLLSIINPKLEPSGGDTDVCVMWNTVTGIKDGQKTRVDYYMWDEADTENGISSMARVTGFSAAIGAKLIGSGEMKKRGIVAPEDCIEGELYEKFMNELRKKGINILETVNG